MGADATLQGRIDSIHAACSARILRFTPGAPEAVATEALVLYAAWIYQIGAQSRQVFPTDGAGRVTRRPLVRERGRAVVGDSWRGDRAGRGG